MAVYDVQMIIWQTRNKITELVTKMRLPTSVKEPGTTKGPTGKTTSQVMANTTLYILRRVVRCRNGKKVA
jgi:hypothetical protein